MVMKASNDVIIRLVAEGFTNAEIAARVNASAQTVTRRLTKIYRSKGISPHSGGVSRRKLVAQYFAERAAE